MGLGRFWTSALLLAALLPGACGDGSSSAPRKALEERRAALLNAIASNPEVIVERVELARVAIRLGDGVGAETAVKGALSAGANDAALRPLLARAYAMQDEGNRALQTLDDGPIIPEMIGEAAWVAGDVHLAGGDLDAAREAYDRAVHELPRSSALWVDVARFRDANADVLGARDAVDYAIELDKRNGPALAFKANLVRTEDGLKASLDWYEEALAADPDNADALIEQAATLGDLGRYRDMLASLRHAATIVPRDPRLFYLQAVLAARADNYLHAAERDCRTRTRRRGGRRKLGRPAAGRAAREFYGPPHPRGCRMGRWRRRCRARSLAAAGRAPRRRQLVVAPRVAFRGGAWPAD
jgi:tetratricopeptide (TPR) repeat protein